MNLANLTTLQLGGPARRIVHANNSQDLVEQVREVSRSGEDLLILGGGSNVVIADEGFDGVVCLVCSRGIELSSPARLIIQAGEPWDHVVSFACAHDLSGIECLSGIPGSTGAAPIQNIGAYGASVADFLERVRVYDRVSDAVVDLTRDECAFGYRTSRFKKDAGRFIVLELELALTQGPQSAPIRYEELARDLDIPLHGQAPSCRVREAVLTLRRRKGMVLDRADPDSRSAGSFFTNPILDLTSYSLLKDRVNQYLEKETLIPSWPEANETQMKVSAAWLIANAGFEKGYALGAAGISTKHTLALVNRGGATTRELLLLAREIREKVHAIFGVILEAEPVLIGAQL